MDRSRLRQPQFSVAVVGREGGIGLFPGTNLGKRVGMGRFQASRPCMAPTLAFSFFPFSHSSACFSAQAHQCHPAALLRPPQSWGPEGYTSPTQGSGARGAAPSQREPPPPAGGAPWQAHLASSLSLRSFAEQALLNPGLEEKASHSQHPISHPLGASTQTVKGGCGAQAVRRVQPQDSSSEESRQGAAGKTALVGWG